MGLGAKQEKMTATEKKYLCERIQRIVWDKERALRDAYKIDEKSISPVELVRLIKAGKLLPKKKRGTIYPETCLRAIFDVESVPQWCRGAEKKAQENANKFSKFAQRVKDEVMLGSSEDALNALERIEKWKPMK